MRERKVKSASLFRFLEVDPDMAKRNSSQFGTLYIEGKPGQRQWKVRYFKTVLHGKVVRRVRAKSPVGPADGPGKLSRRQAEVLAWNLYVKHQQRGHVERACTLREFWEHVFTSHISRLKLGSQKDYETRWRNWVLPELGEFQIQQITTEQITKVVYAPLQSDRSVQTAAHVRKLLQAIFTHAKDVGYFVGENPAASIELPEMTRREAYAYSPREARQILKLLPSPILEAVLLLLTTGLTAAEMRGARWCRANLTTENTIAGGRALPPLCLEVAENFYLGQYGTPKAKKRRRIVPLLPAVVAALAGLKATTRYAAPDDPIFAAAKGKPIDTHNVSNRLFALISADLGFPVGWHNFRHTHSTCLDQDATMSMADRVAQMGHASTAMTLHYSHSDLDRRRAALEWIDEQLQPAKRPSWPDMQTVKVQ